MYVFNPHRHVKIWLSKNPDIFMNQENQFRMVKMRALCPNDVINFIYDKTLLSPNACKNLKEFCEKHKFIPIEMNDDITPECLKNKHERRLIEIYKDEITHLTEGGNLAAASDIVRWLRPVSKLGTYSDLDVSVNTTELPNTIDVESEILLNIGSVVLDDDARKLLGGHEILEKLLSKYPENTRFSGELENLGLNNDIVAILNPESEVIQKVQESMIDAYTPSNTSKSIDELFLFMIPPSIRPDITKLNDAGLFASYGGKKISPREYRDNIKRIYSNDNSAQLKYTEYYAYEREYEEYARTLSQPMIFLIWGINLALNAANIFNTFIAAKSILDLVNTTRDRPNNILQDTLPSRLFDDPIHSRYLNSVTYSTGPFMLINQLFDNKRICTVGEIDKIKHWSIRNYEPLKKAFKSTQSVDLHMSINQSTQTMGDLSWMPLGEELIENREKKYDPSATKIQAVYRGFKARTTAINIKKAKTTDDEPPPNTPAV